MDGDFALFLTVLLAILVLVVKNTADISSLKTKLNMLLKVIKFKGAFKK